jgi:hypothetical protein
VRDLIVDGKGGIWILNEVEPYFVNLAADGTVLVEWGRQGGGPTEFRNPSALARGTAPGDVWVFDRARLRLLLVSSGPEGLRELAVARDSLPWTPLSFDDMGIGGTRSWLARVDEGFLMAGTRLPPTTAPQPLAHWTAELFRIDDADATVSVHASILSMVGEPAAAGIPVRILMPNPLWATCDDGGLAIYDPAHQEIRRLSTGQTPELRVSVPSGAPIRVTLDRIFGAIWIEARERKRPEHRRDSASMHRAFIEESQEIKDHLATNFPEFMGLHCTGRDTFWLQRFALSTGRMGRGPHWLRVRGNGDLLEVQLPAQFRPFRFSHGRVWGIVHDEWNVPHIASVLLPS